MVRSQRSCLRLTFGWAGVLAVVSLLLILGVPEIGYSQLAAYPVTVFKSGGGTGTVTSAGLTPSEIDCGVTCSALGPEAGPVTLTAVADAGSTFIGWVGKGCSGTGTCGFTLSQASTVVAMFGRTGASGFSPVDLAGTWYFSTLTDSLVTNSPGWVSMTLVLNGAGTFESGDYYPSDSDNGLAR